MPCLVCSVYKIYVTCVVYCMRGGLCCVCFTRLCVRKMKVPVFHMSSLRRVMLPVFVLSCLRRILSVFHVC